MLTSQVEVKGPRDKLDARQRAWLCILAQAGVNAKVAKVRLPGSKAGKGKGSGAASEEEEEDGPEPERGVKVRESPGARARGTMCVDEEDEVEVEEETRNTKRAKRSMLQ